MSNPLAPKSRREGLEGWIHAAKMSALAYKSGATWNHEMRQAGWPESGFITPGAGFEAGWAFSERFPVAGHRKNQHRILEFACRGTLGVRDLWLDLWSGIPNTWRQLRPGWLVGYGMVRGPRYAWAEIQEIISRCQPNEVRWWGHSKGAGAAELCHAACRIAGIRSSCVAVEPPRVFFPLARAEYRALIRGEGNDCQVIINTSHGYRDAITAYPRWPFDIHHGGNLNVLGKATVYSGNDALMEWARFKRGARKGWSPGRRAKGRFGAHGLEGVSEHMEALLELQGKQNHKGGIR